MADDFLLSVQTDGGPREPIPVTLVSGGLEAIPLQNGGSVAVSNLPATQPVSNAALTSLDAKAQPNNVTPVTGLGVTALLVRNTPSNFYSASITAGATAGFLIAYNATAIPASGATLTPSLVLNAIQVGASGFATLGGNPVPDRFSNGVVLLFSTSLATYTVPANPAVFMRGA